MYNVTVDDIYKLNPESKNGIRAGSALKIPQKSGSYYYHTIQPKETLYSVSKEYGMKGEDVVAANPGLSVQTFTIGKTIRIPTNMVTTPMDTGNESAQKRETEALLTQMLEGTDIKMIKVALLLPFGLKGNINNNAQGNRFVEYYEGFLMALMQTKNAGISVDLQVYDIGDDVADLSAILKKNTIQDVNLLIGGLNDKQIRMISAFSKDKGIPYVIPFTSKSDEPLNNPHIFQINTPQSYLYSKASTAFCRQFKDKQVIFFLSDPANEKMEFVKTLQADLTQMKETFKSVSYSDRFYQDAYEQMNPDKLNVIIPSDDSPETLTKIAAPLKALSETHPDLRITVFGYPEWQVHSSEYMESYFKLRAGFYSGFYADPTSPEVKNFYYDFNNWYSRDLISTFPKFGILGYDTGMFFIKGLHEYGTAFEANINKVKNKGIQTDFKFERVNNWGGFINTNIYIISFNPDFSISKNASR
jgi:LysM repeat protein